MNLNETELKQYGKPYYLNAMYIQWIWTGLNIIYCFLSQVLTSWFCFTYNSSLRNRMDEFKIKIK